MLRSWKSLTYRLCSFTEHLLCSRHCSRSQGYSSETNRQKPLPFGSLCSKGGGPTACAGLCSKLPRVREKSKGGRRKREHEGSRVRAGIPEEVTLEHRLEGDDPAARERGSGRSGGSILGRSPVCWRKDRTPGRMETVIATVALGICASWGPCFCVTPHLWVWAGPRDLLPMNIMWQKWQHAVSGIPLPVFSLPSDGSSCCVASSLRRNCMACSQQPGSSWNPHPQSPRGP